MADEKTYNDVTAPIFDCVKTTGEKTLGTKFVPPDANQGTATTQSSVGEIVLNFDFDPQASTLTYKILKKPFMVSENQIWDSIQGGIDGCRK